MSQETTDIVAAALKAHWRIVNGPKTVESSPGADGGIFERWVKAQNSGPSSEYASINLAPQPGNVNPLCGRGDCQVDIYHDHRPASPFRVGSVADGDSFGPINTGYGTRSPAVTVLMDKEREIARLKDELEGSRRREERAVIEACNSRRECVERRGVDGPDIGPVVAQDKHLVAVRLCIELAIEVRKDMDGRYFRCKVCRAETREDVLTHKPECRVAEVCKA